MPRKRKKGNLETTSFGRAVYVHIDVHVHCAKKVAMELTAQKHPERSGEGVHCLRKAEGHKEVSKAGEGR